MEELLDIETYNGLKDLLEEEFPSFLEMFFSENQDALDGIKTGLAANDADSVKRAAHNLKSSTGYLGAMQLSELARQIEEGAAANDLSNTGELYEQAQSMFETIKTTVL